MIPPMPDDFRLPAALSSLGNPLQVHPPKALAGRAGYFTVALILLILAGLTVLAIVNPPQNNPPPMIVLFIVMGISLTAALVLFGMGMYSRSYTLILFPDALAQIAGDAAEIFRWSDIRDVYTYVSPAAAMYRLVTGDGRKLQIDKGVKDGKKLGETVRQALLDHMTPAALDAFQRGQTLAFGPLQIDRAFLHYKEKRLAWYEVTKMQLHYNPYTRAVQFELTAGGAVLPWCSVKAQDIPNLDVFKTLAEQMKAFTP
jgi:Family of unknown function (DUF6585)